MITVRVGHVLVVTGMAASLALVGCGHSQQDADNASPDTPNGAVGGASNAPGAGTAATNGGAPAGAPGTTSATGAGSPANQARTASSGQTGSATAPGGPRPSGPAPAGQNRVPGRGPGGPAGPGMRGGPGGAQFAAMQSKFPGTMALMRDITGVRTLVMAEAAAHPVTPSEGLELAGFLKPLLTKPTLSQDEAQKIVKRVDARLTSDQKTELAGMRQHRGGFGGGFGRRGGGAGGSMAGGPGGGAGGGGWPGRGDAGGPGGQGGWPGGGDGGAAAGGQAGESGGGGWPGRGNEGQAAGGPGGGGPGMRGGPGGGGRRGGMMMGLTPDSPANTNPYLQGRNHDRLAQLIAQLSGKGG